MDIRDLPEAELRELNEVLYLVAYRITKSRERATELRQEAMVRLMGSRAWDPAKQPSLARYAWGVVSSLISHQYESDTTRVEYEKEADTERQVLDGAAAPNPEDAVIEANEEAARDALHAERMAELRRRLEGRPLELEILEHSDETLKPAELVEITKRSLAEVNVALKHIRRQVRAIAAGAQPDDEKVAS